MPLRIYHKFFRPFLPAFQSCCTRIIMSLLDQILFRYPAIHYIFDQLCFVLLTRQPYIRQLSVTLPAVPALTPVYFDLITDLLSSGLSSYPVCPSFFLLFPSTKGTRWVLIALYPKKSDSSLYSSSKSVMMFTVCLRSRRWILPGMSPGSSFLFLSRDIISI